MIETLTLQHTLVWIIAILSFSSHYLLGSQQRIGWLTYFIGAFLSIWLYVLLGFWPFVLLNVLHLFNFYRSWKKWGEILNLPVETVSLKKKLKRGKTTIERRHPSLDLIVNIAILLTLWIMLYLNLYK